MAEPERRVARVAASAALVFTVVSLAAEAVLQLAVVDVADGDVLLLTVLVACIVNGLVLVRHRPDNPIGWILVVAGAPWVWMAPLTTWAAHLVMIGRPLDAWAVAGLWINEWSLPLVLAPVMFYLPVVFPDGHLPSPRWRWVARAVSVCVAALVLMGMTVPMLTSQDVEVSHPNPLGVSWMPATEGSPVGDALYLAILLGMGAAIVNLVVRFRRSRGAGRLQMKWFLAAAALQLLLPVWEVLSVAVGVPDVLGELLFPVVVGCLPTSITLAVLRHRLWDIDRLVSRTVAYVLLAVLLVAVYLAGVLGLGALARAVTGEEGDLVVALSTLAVAAVFQPLRRRVQDGVDRRFNRSRYDAAGVVERFGRDLRDEVSLATNVDGLRRVAAETVHPSSTSVFLLREGTR